MASASVGLLCDASVSLLQFCTGEKLRAFPRSNGNVGALTFVRMPQRGLRRIVVGNVRMSASDEREPAQGDDCCDVSEAKWGRRELGAAAALAFFVFTSSIQRDAAASGFDKYLKRKKLDPLDTYVPTVLLAQSQFQEVDGKLGGEQKTYADARSLLRVGPAASLRTDIRAVAQYAEETGNDDGARAAVDQCLRALEDLDSLLLQASRSPGAPVERMREDLTTTVSALDRLLATVPRPILERAKAIAEAYKDASY